MNSIIYATNYLVLDAAQNEMLALADTLPLTPSYFKSLFELNNNSAHLSSIAPYLLQISDPRIHHWFLREAWSKAWGILIKSNYSPEGLRTHLRRFTKVRTFDNRSLYFRFYDPRVLRIFLPTCDKSQILEFFGNVIDYFICEDEDPRFALRFWHENGVLKNDRFSVTEIISALNEPGSLPQLSEAPLPQEATTDLKEQGLLEQVLQARGETVSRPDIPSDEPSDPQLEQPLKNEKTALDPQKKTKWNMFD